MDADRRDVKIGGLAGTGKTTIASLLPEYLNTDSVKYLAPTNQAAFVQAKKAGVEPSTIHRYIYSPG
jgi:cytidylate kinase